MVVAQLPSAAEAVGVALAVAGVAPHRGSDDAQAPARASTRSAATRTASSSICPSRATAPAPPERSASSSAAITARACDDLLLRGREQLVQRGDLRRVDRPLAVEAHVARALGGGREALVDGDPEVRPVDREHAVGARGDEHASWIARHESSSAPAPAARPSDADRSA